MAPEQAAAGTVDARADLFSLGCVLYRACTGKLPFLGRDSIAMLVAIRSTQPPPPHEVDPSLPRGFSDLVMRLLAKEPGERPETALTVADALAALERELAASLPYRPTEPIAVARPPVRPRQRLTWIAAGVAACLLVLGGVLLWRVWPSS